MPDARRHGYPEGRRMPALTVGNAQAGAGSSMRGIMIAGVAYWLGLIFAALRVAGLRVVTLALATLASLAACGGGGGDALPAWSGVTIEVPTEDDAFLTHQPQLPLSGRAFVPVGSNCNATVGTIAPGYRVRWRNAANGAGGDARMQLNCLLQASLTWDVPVVPLVVGSNVITVTATAGDGQAGSDSVAVTRTP
jgi:hypothetical protein